MESVRKLGTGISWREAGGLDFKGNGTAMRSGIVGCAYWKSPELAFRFGCLTSVCTHNNLEAILASGVVAYLVAAQIKGDSYSEAVANALLLCADFENPLRVPVYPHNVKIGTGYHDQNPWYAVARFGAAYALGTGDAPIISAISALQDPSSIVKDGAAVPAVAEAIFFNARFDSYSDIVLNAANNSDDTDTIAAISGVIAGARLGYGSIDQLWTAKIELRDYLIDLSTRIWEMSYLYTPVELPHNEVNMANSEDVATLLTLHDDSDLDREELVGEANVLDEEDEYEVEF